MNPLPQDVTLVKNAIHNPADARHFMRITTAEQLVTVRCGGLEIARSTAALKVKEVGYDIYDAVFYFPRVDVEMSRLEKTPRTTHCPLKGDTEYFDLLDTQGRVESIAWSYHRTIDVAAALKDYISFDTRLVEIVTHRAG